MNTKTGTQRKNLDDLIQSKRKKVVKRGKVVLRRNRFNDEAVAIKQVKKKHIRYARKDEKGWIDYNKLLPSRKGYCHNLKSSDMKISKKVAVLNTIFEEVILKIMEDMVENKNEYLLSNGMKFFIGTFKDPQGKYTSFFTFDTQTTEDIAVITAESGGFTWKVIPPKKIGLKLKEYNDVRKYRYTSCKTFLGKQLWGSSRGKLNSLTRKLSKHGLSLSSLLQHLK